jgi:hypothetical protein
MAVLSALPNITASRQIGAVQYLPICTTFPKISSESQTILQGVAAQRQAPTKYAARHGSKGGVNSIKFVIFPTPIMNFRTLSSHRNLPDWNSSMFSQFDDHGLPLVALKEQRRDLIIELMGRNGPLSKEKIAEIAAIQQAIAAIESVICDLDAEVAAYEGLIPFLASANNRAH